MAVTVPDEMTRADEFVARFRAVLRQHAKRTSSIPIAAKTLDIGISTFYQFLKGGTDPGFQRCVQWAEQIGLEPEQWAAKTGLAPGDHAGLLHSTLSLEKPADPLLLACAKLGAKLRFRLKTPPPVPEIVLTIDDVFHDDPIAAEALASRCLRNKLRQLRTQHRLREKPLAADIVEFFCLVGTYAVRRHINTAPRTTASGLAMALEALQFGGESPALTWLVIDASTVLRRLFKVNEALFLARAAASAALIQDPSRLLPRALLNLAAILFSKGHYREAASLYELIYEACRPNPYQKFAAFGASTALARCDPKRAAALLAEKAEILDKLPACRQLQRWWTHARVLGELDEEDRALSFYAAALQADEDHCDPRDAFLLFEEARLLVGSSDPRLQPMAARLPKQLARLSRELPGAFLLAKNYIDHLEDLDEEGMRAVIDNLVEGDNRHRRRRSTG